MIRVCIPMLEERERAERERKREERRGGEERVILDQIPWASNFACHISQKDLICSINITKIYKSVRVKFNFDRILINLNF